MFEIRGELTAVNILDKISDFDIFKAYCPNFKEVGVKFLADSRKESLPSCIISHFNGKLWFKDFGSVEKAVTCFGYVMNKYSCTYVQALGIINNDFNLGLKSYQEHKPSLNYVGLPDIYLPKPKEPEDKIIEVSYRSWLSLDEKFWYNRYYLKIPRLEFYNIRPIDKLFLNGSRIEIPIESYAFLIDVENGINRYKIYCPFYKKLKWLSNCKANHYQGFNQLPWLNERLVITKSLKDVAVLSLFKIPSIAPQTEAQLIPIDFMESLKKRFNKIYLFFDNDKQGVKGSRKNSELHNIPEVFISESYGVKDISDFLEKFRYKETNSLIKKLFK